MGKQHRDTFILLNEKPDRNDVKWSDFINLLRYLGATIRNQSGSAHGIRLNGNYAVFHKPHPGHTIYKSDLSRIRRFLKDAGIKDVNE